MNQSLELFHKCTKILSLEIAIFYLKIMVA